MLTYIQKISSIGQFFLSLVQIFCYFYPTTAVPQVSDIQSKGVGVSSLSASSVSSSGAKLPSNDLLVEKASVQLAHECMQKTND
jgi:hypothetical protein